MRRILVVAAALAMNVSLLSFAATPPQTPLREPACQSKNPLYFRVTFGQDEKQSMVGVLDESGGTGKGYSVAYIDENMNNDLTDEAPKKFEAEKGGAKAGQLRPRFEFNGPFGETGKAKYTLNLYSLANPQRSQTPPRTCHFFWYLNTGGWNYMFINGQVNFFPTATEAIKGKAVALGGKCAWQITSANRNGKTLVSAGLKDANGCTLRTLGGPPVAGQTGARAPMLTLLKENQKAFEQKMEFG